MTTSSLFGHLVGRFATHPENLATEALGYILRQSVVARDALRALLYQSGISIEGDLAFQNQVGGVDSAQPDIVGLDQDGKQRLVLEAKFWAQLTDQQPVTYIGRLPLDNGVLLFVAPSARVTLLWGELLRRCADAGVSGSQVESGFLSIPRFTCADGRYLALVSWRTLLESIMSRLDAAGERTTLADVQQLMGLCEYMDTAAFIPITSEELTSPLFRRVLQFADLADDAVSALVNSGHGDVKSLNRQSFKGVSGRYFRLRGHGAYLSCDLYKWNVLAATPIWLTFGQGWPLSPEVRDALAPLAANTPPGVFTGDKGTLVLPLYVPILKTRETVLDTLVGQLMAIADRLPIVGPTSPDATTVKEQY